MVGAFGDVVPGASVFDHAWLLQSDKGAIEWWRSHAGQRSDQGALRPGCVIAALRESVAIMGGRTGGAYKKVQTMSMEPLPLLSLVKMDPWAAVRCSEFGMASRR
jgi:hypothetical protein